MAGSWNHMTTKTGRFRGTRHLENLGDCYEALEECYGMVWFLADQLAGQLHHGERVQPTRDQVLSMIAQAQAHYEDGLAMGGLASKRLAGQ